MRSIQAANDRLTAIAASFLISAIVQAVCAADDSPLQPSGSDKPRDYITFVAFSPTGEHFATCSRDEVVRIFDAATCKLTHALTVPDRDSESSLGGVAFSPDGKLIVSMQCGGKSPNRNRRVLAIWDAVEGKFLRNLWPAQHRGTDIVTSCRFSSDGSEVWVSDGPTVLRWSVASGRVSTYYVDWMLHGRFRFRRNGTPVIVHGKIQLHVVDPVTADRLFTFNGESLDWGDVLSSGDRFVATTQKREVVLGKLATARVENRFQPLNGGAGWIRRLRGKGNLLLVFTTTGYIERWDLDKVECTGVLPQPIAIANSLFDSEVEYGRADPSIFRIYHATPITISPDSSRLVIIGGRQLAVVPLDWQEP